MEDKHSTKNKERQFILECIRLYRSLPALWNTKSKLYNDRDQKNMAYDVLLSKYREMFVEATKDDVKRKFNVLRTNYRKELKKLMNSLKYGAGTDCVYESSLWYFEEMRFLHDQDLPLESESSMDITEYLNVNEKQTTETPISILAANDDSTFAESPKQNVAAKRVRTEGRLLDLAYERLSENKDEYYHWGMAFASDLRNLEKTQQIYAKKAFAEILMEAQLGLLHRNSVKINEEPATCASSSAHCNPSPFNPSPNLPEEKDWDVLVKSEP